MCKMFSSMCINFLQCVKWPIKMLTTWDGNHFSRDTRLCFDDDDEGVILFNPDEVEMEIMVMMMMTLMLKKDGGGGASPADLTLGIRHRSTFALSHTICAFDRWSIFEDDLDHENFDFWSFMIWSLILVFFPLSLKQVDSGQLAE